MTFLTIIILFFSTYLYCVSPTTKIHTNCMKISTIDSTEFYKHKKESSPYFSYTDTTSSIDTIIEVTTKNKKIYFESDFSDEYFVQYRYIGEQDNMVLVLEEAYNTEKYFLINRITSKIDTLVAKPNFYGDKILCIESEGIDSDHKYIEVWELNTNSLKLLSRLNIQQCNIFAIDDFYLSGNFVFLKTANNIFLKYDFLSFLSRKNSLN